MSRKRKLAASTPPPVEPVSGRAQMIMLSEVEKQCQFAVLAAGDLNQALEAKDTTRIWFAIQNLLTAVANVSKLLWGDFKTEALERKPLRDTLAVGEASPIKTRVIRNHLEHIDSRITEHFGPDYSGVVVTRYIGPSAALPVGSEEEWFHHFDYQTNEVTFRGDSVSLQAVVNEISRVLPLAQMAARAR
jgi:hypothetical protein